MDRDRTFLTVQYSAIQYSTGTGQHRAIVSDASIAIFVASMSVLEGAVEEGLGG